MSEGLSICGLWPCPKGREEEKIRPKSEIEKKKKKKREPEHRSLCLINSDPRAPRAHFKWCEIKLALFALLTIVLICSESCNGGGVRG